MKKELQELAHEDEEKLVKELASMRVELTPEADFEARFLADFHERLAETEAVAKPKLPFFVRVKAAIASPYGRAWVMGACAVVVVGFLVGGLVFVPEKEDGFAAAVSRVAPVSETSLDMGKALKVGEKPADPSTIDLSSLMLCDEAPVPCEASEEAPADEEKSEAEEQAGE